MPAQTSLLPNLPPRPEDSEVVRLIAALPGEGEEHEPVYRIGMANEDGTIYRTITLYSMSDVLHLATALSKLHFSFNSPLPHQAAAVDGVFTKE